MKRSIGVAILTIILVLETVCLADARQDCTAIKATAYIDKAESNKIRIDLNGMSEDDIVVSIFLPGGKHDLDTRQKVFSNLEKGKYLIVFSGRSEDSSFCNKHIKLIIP
jgi:hypothetical protein